MSIVNAFDNKTDALINPCDIVSKKPGFPETALVCFGERFIDALAEHYGAENIDIMIAAVVVPIYKFTVNNRDYAAYCTPLGGPAAAGLMEEMIAKGCKTFLFFGSCGVLDSSIPEGHLIIPTEAYRDEGTSYHYAPGDTDFITVKTASRLAEILTELKIPHVSGKTWTTDAFYRETAGNTAKRKAEGCITVDMECASVSAVADFRQIEVYYILYAADSLDKAEWDSRSLGKLTQDSRENFMRIAVSVIEKI
jgi:uridine phosphorylase